jgi:large subunit ribosomal protein L24
MKKEWSKDWKSSIKPRKQRKYRFNAPLHVKQKFMRVHLSKDLKGKYEKRNALIRKGDKIKMVRGQFKTRTGEINMVSLRRGKVYVEGINNVKKDGSTSMVALQPSNMVITSLNLEDKKRKVTLERKITNKEKK